MRPQLPKLHAPQHGTAMHSYRNIFIYSPPSPLPSPSLTPCREGKMETHTEPPHKNTLLTDLEHMDAGGIEETEVRCQRGISQP